jgi:hypothetical protein
MRVEALGPRSAIERLNERIVGWFARPTEVEGHVVLIRPQIEVARDELGALIDADRVWIADLRAHPVERGHHIFAAVAEPRIDGRGEPREQINNREDAKLRTRRQLVVHEVHCPGLVRTGRLLAAVPQLGLHAPLRRFGPQLQA